MADITQTTRTGKAVTVTLSLASDEYIVIVNATQGTTTKTARIDFLPG